MNIAKRFNFTKAGLAALKSPTARTAFFDTRTRGLMILVTKQGAKSFYVRRKVNGRSERIYIGRLPEWKVDRPGRAPTKSTPALDVEKTQPKFDARSGWR